MTDSPSEHWRVTKFSLHGRERHEHEDMLKRERDALRLQLSDYRRANMQPPESVLQRAAELGVMWC